MEDGVFKSSGPLSLRGGLSAVLFTLAVAVAVIAGLRRAEGYSRAEGLRLLRESLQNAVVQCYVAEGSYPPSLLYIEEHYGVRVDRASYAVHYEVFAPNMMPNITVLELDRGERA